MATSDERGPRDTAGGRRADMLVLAAALVLYVPFVFLGYGSDNDSYGVLDSGRELLQHHRYVPSRPPGYLVYEVSIGILSRVGGSVLCNAASVVMALIALACFLRICEHFGVRHRHLLAVTLMVQPVFWLNATCTMDYVWALAMLLGGFLLLLRRWYLLGAILLSLAVGTRLSSFIAAGIFLIYPLRAYPKDRLRVVAAGAVAIVIGALCYLPSFRQAGYTTAFLHAGVSQGEMWSTKMKLGRFVYKNIYLWGLPATLVGAGLCTMIVFRREAILRKQWRGLVVVCLALLVGYEALFVKYPIEPAYLLQAVPAVLMLLGMGLSDRPRLLMLFAIAVASYAVVNINLARPNQRDKASSARIGLWVERGYIIQDVPRRKAVMGCATLECFTAKRLTD